MKIELLREGDRGFHPETSPRPRPLLRSLPFWRSGYPRRSAPYVHRVRSGLVHFEHDTPTLVVSHVSFRFWCGQQGFLFHLASPGSRGPRERGGNLLAEPPEGVPVCATCEGRAIGWGQPPSSVLAKPPLRFAPYGAR